MVPVRYQHHNLQDRLLIRISQCRRTDRCAGQALGVSVNEEFERGYCTLISFKEGAIQDAGIFREDDIILEVNGTYVGDMKHEDLVGTLCAAFPSFTLTVINEDDFAKHIAGSKTGAREQRSLREDSESKGNDGGDSDRQWNTIAIVAGLAVAVSIVYLLKK